MTKEEGPGAGGTGTLRKASSIGAPHTAIASKCKTQSEAEQLVLLRRSCIRLVYDNSKRMDWILAMRRELGTE